MTANDPASAPKRALAIIMGGGAGTRLFPLTKDRAKPAVPLGGKYRLVDIPISNCINSGLRRMFILTQYNSVSLHRHIHASYKFDDFGTGFVGILAAQQTPQSLMWYQGTADAVRQNLRYFLEQPVDQFVILSGDQLYQMDFRALLVRHNTAGADLTIATLPVGRDQATGFGIMQSDATGRLLRFEEKPKDPAVLDSLRIPASRLKELGREPFEELFEASMGIYIFNREALVNALDNDFADFGKHIIPAAIRQSKVRSDIFEGYWEDIGTIRSFYEANLALTDVVPPFSFFNADTPVFTHPRFLPGSKVNGATIHRAILSEGCVISDAHIERSVVGIRSVINAGSTIRNSIIMGADYYEHDAPSPRPTGAPPLGIGPHCVVERAIIDKNARIGEGAVITPEGKPENFDGDNFYIRDGIVVVPKNACIPARAWV